MRVVHDPGGQRLAGAPDPVQERPGVARALLRIARRRRTDQRVEVRRDAVQGPAPVGVDPVGRLRDVLVHVGVRHLDRRVAGVRLLAGEHLEQHDAGRVDVGAGVGVAVLDQLGRQVRHRADEQALGGGGRLGGDRAGQPEVGHLQQTPAGDQDVLRLHVAVDQACVVRGAQRRQDRVEQVQRTGRRQRGLAAHQPAQCRPLHQFHHDVGSTEIVALIENRDYVGVRQVCSSPGFAIEVRREVLVVAEALVHDLDRHGAVQSPILRAVDRGHAATRQARDDLVATVEGTADQCVDSAGMGHVCS